MTNAIFESDSGIARFSDCAATRDWKARCRWLARRHEHEADRFAHEFRGPLTVIKEYASLLEDDLLEDLDDEGRQYLAVIDDRADDLCAMVDDMLNLSRLQRGRLIPYRTRCRAAELIEELRPFLEKKAALKGAQWRIESPDKLPDLYCDSEMIVHSLQNLVAFLLRFAAEPSGIVVGVSDDPAGGNVVFSISGEVPRLAVDAQQAIYERLAALFADSHETREGLRIGLQVARAMVEVNFGRLGVSTRLGESCAFSFALPVADPAEMFRRYMAALERRYRTLHSFSAVQISLEGAADAHFVDDLDRLLHRCVRPYELFLQVGPAEWGLVTPVDEAGLPQASARIARAIQRAHRRRGGRSLPRACQTCVGSWPAETAWTAIPAYVRKLFSLSPTERIN